MGSKIPPPSVEQLEEQILRADAEDAQAIVAEPRDSLVVLAKTGTLNEVTSRSNDDVYLKSLAVVVGKRARGNSGALRCGVVAILHLEFRQDVTVSWDRSPAWLAGDHLLVFRKRESPPS